MTKKMNRSNLDQPVLKSGLCFWLLVGLLVLSCQVPGAGVSTEPAAPVAVTRSDTATAAPQPTKQPTPVVTATLGERTLWRSSRIAFASDRGGSYQIYLIRPDGSGLTRLTDSPGDNLSPAWSPDAQHLAFASTRDGNSEIYVTNPEGTKQANVTHSISEDHQPIWISRDRIAFVSDRLGRERIFLMDANGENVQSLKYASIDSPERFLCLTWLGEDVLSYTFESAEARDVRIVDIVTGASVKPQAFNQGFDHSCPLIPALISNPWTVYISKRDGQDQIYKFDPQRDKEEPLTSGLHPSTGPSRSSDEGWITFYSQRTGNWDIFVMDVDGKDQWNVTNDPSNDIQPAWEPY